MQEVKLYIDGLGEDMLDCTFTGVIRFDVSPMGVIGIQQYTGVQTVYSLSRFSKVETTPLTDEDILNGKDVGFANWYREQKETAEAAQKQEAVS